MSGWGGDGDGWGFGDLFGGIGDFFGGFGGGGGGGGGSGGFGGFGGPSPGTPGWIGHSAGDGYYPPGVTAGSTRSVGQFFDNIGGFVGDIGIGDFTLGNLGEGVFEGIGNIGTGIGNIGTGNLGTGIGNIGTGIGNITSPFVGDFGSSIITSPIDAVSRGVELIGGGVDFLGGLSIEGNIGGEHGITAGTGPGGTSINIGGPSGLDIGSDDEGLSVSLGGEQGISVGGDPTDMTQLPGVSVGGVDLTGGAQNVVDAALGILPDLPSAGDVGQGVKDWASGVGDPLPGGPRTPSVPSVVPGSLDLVGPPSAPVGVPTGLGPGADIAAPGSIGAANRLAMARRREAAERARQERESLARSAELLRLERRRTGAPKAPLRGRTSQTVGAASPKKSGARLPRAKSSTLLGLGNQPSAANRLLG